MPNTFLSDDMLRQVNLIVGELASHMQMRGWSQAETAAEIGISSSHLGRIISGTRVPSMPVLQKWAGLYRLRVDCDLKLSVDALKLTFSR